MTIGGLLVVVTAKGIHVLTEEFDLIILWFVSQITIGQAYNPNFFRDIGVGVINGALWTITVEILFYIIVPIICLIEKKFKYAVFFFTFFLL